MKQRELKDEISDCFPKSTNGFKIPINLDFDGCCVYHDFPYVGKDNEYCVEIIKKWIDCYNVVIILNTSRPSYLLKPAIEWFQERGIELWAIGKNPKQDWTDSPKSYGYYVDDMCAGIPLIYDDNGRARVDWKKLDEVFTPFLKKLNDNNLKK